MRRWLPAGTLDPLPFLAVAAAAFLFAHDFVGVGIVIPEVQGDFSADLGSVQWAITGFSIAIALSVVPAGRLADVFGAERTLIAGALGFATASALIAVAPALWFLLAARTLEGVGSAFVWISAVALLFGHFGPARPAAAGAWTVLASGLGLALGPIDAGLLIEWLGWRGAFLFNVPVSLFIAFVMLRHLRERPAATDRAIDWTGIGLLAGALVALLVTLRYAPDWGWGSSGSLVGFFVALALFVAFVLQQRAWRYRALVPPDIAANRILAVTLAGEALLGTSYFMVTAFAPQIFVNVLGANAIEAGLMQLPAMASIAVGGAVAGLCLVRVPTSITAVASGALAAVGGFILAMMPDDPSYAALLPGLILVGLASGALFGTLLTIGISSLPEDRKGLASGLLYTVQLAGGAIFLAGGTAIATGVASGAADQKYEGLVQGVQSAFLFGVAVAAVGVLVTLFGYRAALAVAQPAN